MKIPILSHTSESYAQEVRNRLGKGAEHARLIYREWYRSGLIEGKDPHFLNAGVLYKTILDLTDFSALPLIKNSEESQTEKFLLKTADDLEVEMVCIPMKAGYTLCISSQVGCRMGCAFCETGKMGLLRSLTPYEIVSQLFQARHHLKKEIRNIVFMGMGEPLDNYDAVMRAIHIFTDPQGFSLGPSRITISTSGVVKKIYQLMEEADPAICLAVSINAPNNSVRNKLMPVNHQFNMEELRSAMEAYTAHPRRRILIEYILIKQRTDSVHDAAALAEYLRGLRVTVNLIPYNPQTYSSFAPPDQEDIDAFYRVMKQNGYLTFIRATKGQKIMAACGQLGNLKLRGLRKK